MERKTRRGDEGFSIVETVTSLALLGTIMAAMGPFFVGSVRVIARQRTSQVAVQLADSAVAQVRALRGTSLLAGRGQSTSTTQWNNAPAAVKAYQAQMQLAYDSAVAATAGADAPVSTSTQTVTVETTTYSRTVYVGKCDIYLTPGSSGLCVSAATVTPPSDPTKDLLFYRVVILVEWKDSNCGNGTSTPKGTCQYVTSTLIARGTEPVFDVHRPPPAIKTLTLTIYQNQTLSATVDPRAHIDVTGGTLPNKWVVKTGTMPTGTALSADGYITGKPTALGVFKPTIQVTDDDGRSDSVVVQITVVAPFTLTVPSSPKSHVGDAVSLTLGTTGGTGPYAYTANNLPPGLLLNPATGAITGSPTTAGSYTVTATVTDNNGGTATNSFTHVVYPAVTLAVIPDQTVAFGNTLNVTATGSGGGAALTYSATGLPLGVLLNATTGALSGIATVTGRYLPTVTVSDGLGGTGGTASRQFVLLITATGSLIFTSPSFTNPDQSSVVGQNVTMTFATNGATLNLVPTLSATGLPPGLTFNPAAGVISGKTTTAGVYTVTVQAVNLLAAQTSNYTFLWTVT